MRGWETMKICEHSESGVGVEGEEWVNAKRREGMRRERENKIKVHWEGMRNVSTG